MVNIYKLKKEHKKLAGMKRKLKSRNDPAKILLEVNRKQRKLTREIEELRHERRRTKR